MLFPLERNVFNRENASGMYRPSMFYLGRTLAEVPQHLILIAIMGTISYWMYGLQNDAEKFFTFLLLLVTLFVHIVDNVLHLLCLYLFYKFRN